VSVYFVQMVGQVLKDDSVGAEEVVDHVNEESCLSITVRSLELPDFHLLLNKFSFVIFIACTRHELVLVGAE